MLIAALSETLLATAAVLTALGGGLATVYSIIKGKKDSRAAAEKATYAAEQDCHERLLVAHTESEKLAEELHELRMRREP